MKKIFIIIFSLLAFMPDALAHGIGAGEIALARKKFASPIKATDIFVGEKKMACYSVDSELANKYLKEQINNDMATAAEAWVPLAYMCVEDFNKLILANQDLNDETAVVQVSAAMDLKTKFQAEIDKFEAWSEAQAKAIQTARANRLAKEAAANAAYLSSLTPEQRAQNEKAVERWKTLLNPETLIVGVGLQTKEDLQDEIGKYFSSAEGDFEDYKFGQHEVKMMFAGDDKVLSKIIFRISGEDGEKYAANLANVSSLKFDRSYKVKSHTTNALIADIPDLDVVKVYKCKDTTCEVYTGEGFVEVSFSNFKR